MTKLFKTCDECGKKVRTIWQYNGRYLCYRCYRKKTKIIENQYEKINQKLKQMKISKTKTNDWFLIPKRKLGGNIVRLKGMKIAILFKSIKFSDEAIKYFGNKGFVEIYINRNKGLIGFKPSKNFLKGFALKHKKYLHTTRLIQTLNSAFNCDLRSRIFDAVWDDKDKMLIIKIEKQDDKNKKH